MKSLKRVGLTLSCYFWFGTRNRSFSLLLTLSAIWFVKSRNWNQTWTKNVSKIERKGKQNEIEIPEIWPIVHENFTKIPLKCDLLIQLIKFRSFNQIFDEKSISFEPKFNFEMLQNELQLKIGVNEFKQNGQWIASFEPKYNFKMLKN